MDSILILYQIKYRFHYIFVIILYFWLLHVMLYVRLTLFPFHPFEEWEMYAMLNSIHHVDLEDYMLPIYYQYFNFKKSSMLCLYLYVKVCFSSSEIPHI